MGGFEISYRESFYTLITTQHIKGRTPPPKKKKKSSVVQKKTLKMSTRAVWHLKSPKNTDLLKQ
jgi:hypothetical protein